MDDMILGNKVFWICLAIGTIIYMIAFALKGRERNLAGFIFAFLNCMSIAICVLVELYIIIPIIENVPLTGENAIVFIFPIIFLAPLGGGILRSLYNDFYISGDFYRKMGYTIAVLAIIPVIFVIVFIVFYSFATEGFSLTFLLAGIIFFIALLFAVVKLLGEIFNFKVKIPEATLGYIIIVLFVLLFVAYFLKI